MTQTAPVVAEDVQSVQVGDSISDNFTDEEFSQALVPLDTAISQYLGKLKAMSDQVSFHERTLEEARHKLDSRKCSKYQRRQLENDLASASNMVQCEPKTLDRVRTQMWTVYEMASFGHELATACPGRKHKYRTHEIQRLPVRER